MLEDEQISEEFIDSYCTLTENTVTSARYKVHRELIKRSIDGMIKALTATIKRLLVICVHPYLQSLHQFGL